MKQKAVQNGQIYTLKKNYMAAEANSKLPTILTLAKNLRLGNLPFFKHG